MRFANTNNPRLLLIKINRFQQFREVAKCVRLVALSSIGNSRDLLSRRYGCLDIVYSFFYSIEVNLEMSENSSLLVVVSSDRSCCGAMNSQVIDAVIDDILNLQENLIKVQVLSIGKKASFIIAQHHNSIVTGTFAHLEKEVVSFHIAFLVTTRIERVEFDSLVIYFNEFIDVFEQKLSCFEVPSFTIFFWRYYSMRESYSFLLDFYRFSLTLMILVSLDENDYCVIGSRAKTMDLAVRNTADIISALKLIYNKARQSAITTEIIEILGTSNVIS